MRSKDTNFFLSESDIAFLADESIFRRKQEVTQKIMELFGELELSLQESFARFNHIIPSHIPVKKGKISRGENYRGLPWIVLDCPAVFNREGVFAYRTLFWWSHPFSFTFQLSGIQFEHYLERLFGNLNFQGDDTMICINKSQWEHHHETSNYVPLSEFIKSKDFTIAFFREKGFLKLSKTLSLEKHLDLIPRGTEFLDQILKRLG